MSELTHAEQNACGWLETIREHIACLDVDRDRLQELRDERDGYEPSDGEDRLAQTECKTLAEQWAFDNSEDAAELAALVKAVTIEGDELDEDAIRQRIEESPLSVQVRYGWINPGATDAMLKDGPAEYEILLSTGGPALRIIGELSQHNEPKTARLQHQDWGTPWTDNETLVRWASCFHFGD